MLTIPRLQTAAYGTSLKTGSLVILYTVLTINVLALVIRTSIRLETEEENKTEGELDIRYVVNMVVSIFAFLATPLALYGAHRERANFILPYLIIHTAGILLLAINTVTEFIDWTKGAADSSIAVIIFLIVMTALFVYSMLILYSFYAHVKESREEIK